MGRAYSKKRIMFVFALITVVYFSAPVPVRAMAVAEDVMYDWIQENGEAKIVDFKQSGGEIDLIIPAEIDGLPVVSIGSNAFSAAKIKSVTFPETLRIIEEPFYSCDMLEAISVDARNPYYSAADGVLYSKDKTKLIIYPLGKRDEVFVVPSSVTIIETSAIINNPFLKSIHLPGALTELKYSLVECDNLQTVYLYGGPPQTWNDGASIQEGVTILYMKEYAEDYRRINDMGYSCMENPNNIDIYRAFSDLAPAHWANVYVAKALVVDMLDVADGMLNPNVPATRYDFAEWIVRAFALTADHDQTAPFADLQDLAEDKRAYINAAWQNGIVKGTFATDQEGNPIIVFSGNDVITREQAVAMLIRAILGEAHDKTLSDLNESPNSVKPFQDFEKVSAWAKPYASYAMISGITKGDSARNFDPKRFVTKAEAITLIVRSPICVSP